MNHISKPSKMKSHNPIFEIFRKHKDFIEDKKRSVTVDKSQKRQVVKQLANMKKAQDRPRNSGLEMKETEKRLFSPHIENRKRLINNPRTIANDFSVKFMNLNFSNANKPRRAPVEVDSQRLYSF